MENLGISPEQKRPYSQALDPEEEIELQPEETPKERRIGLGTTTPEIETQHINQNKEEVFEVEHEETPIQRAATLTKALEGKLTETRQKLEAKYERYQSEIKKADDEKNLDFISHCLDQETLHPEYADIFRAAQRVACEELVRRYDQRINSDEKTDRVQAKIRLETIKNVLDYQLSAVEKEAKNIGTELTTIQKQLSKERTNPELAEKANDLRQKYNSLKNEGREYLTLLQESKGEAGANIDGVEELLRRLKLPR